MTAHARRRRSPNRKLPGLQRGGSGPMREVVIAAIAGALIGIVVVALLVHFLP
jgi:hypothetical protein